MNYTDSTYFFDIENEKLQSYVAAFKEAGLTDKQKAVELYNKVRDDWWYDPYTISLSKENYKASSIFERTKGNCVEKSVLLIACLRAVGIPARLHLGKVKNHIAIDKLTEKFGSNELTPHGMVNVYLNGKWLKMSPAFNEALCEKFNVEPLVFDGENSSYLQEFNGEGSLFMEYVDDYGHFEDVPLAFMIEKLKEHYPHIFDTGEGITEFKV